MRPRRRRKGQALVEFAFTFPIFILFVFTIIQLGLVAVMYFSEAYMTLVTARWLAINRDATDVAVANQVNSTLLPGQVGGTPVLTQAGTTSVPTIYQVGRMTVTFTPCIVQSGSCTHDDRLPGDILFVETQYNMSNLFFIPTEFRIGVYTITLPTSLPVYRVYALAE